mmetsp:Transcript_11676/g.32520  ORF Transcript_11676/g.32520 Transcript_11676/m.32520 type:complete len:302 (+) Transcript_11676:238-1143(+)
MPRAAADSILRLLLVPVRLRLRWAADGETPRTRNQRECGPRSIPPHRRAKDSYHLPGQVTRAPRAAADSILRRVSALKAVRGPALSPRSRSRRPRIASSAGSSAHTPSPRPLWLRSSDVIRVRPARAGKRRAAPEVPKSLWLNRSVARLVSGCSGGFSAIAPPALSSLRLRSRNVSRLRQPSTPASALAPPSLMALLLRSSDAMVPTLGASMAATKAAPTSCRWVRSAPSAESSARPPSIILAYSGQPLIWPRLGMVGMGVAREDQPAGPMPFPRTSSEVSFESDPRIWLRARAPSLPSEL